MIMVSGEVFDYLVAHGRMKEKEARSKFRQVGSNEKTGKCIVKYLKLFIYRLSLQFNIFIKNILYIVILK